MVGEFARNGREHYSTGATHRREADGYEQLGWAILEQAIDDLAALGRAGVIRRDGSCPPWPRVWQMRWADRRRVYALKVVSNMANRTAHTELRAFFLNGTAQWLCDWVGCRIPAKEIFYTTLKNHAK
jgi:hypothetical protein